MPKSRHFENLSSYLRGQSSIFDQIGYADMNFYSDNGQLMNIRSFALDGNQTPYSKSVSWCISGAIWPIHEKFATRMQN